MRKTTMFKSNTLSAMFKSLFAGLFLLMISSQVYAVEETQQVPVYAAASTDYGVDAVATMTSAEQTAPDGLATYKISFNLKAAAGMEITSSATPVWGIKRTTETNAAHFIEIGNGTDATNATDEWVDSIYNIQVVDFNANGGGTQVSDITGVYFSSVSLYNCASANKDGVAISVDGTTYDLGIQTVIDLNAESGTTDIAKFGLGAALTNQPSKNRWSVTSISLSVTFEIEGTAGHIAFVANGASGAMADQATIGIGVTLDPLTYTNDGYHFAGWATTIDGDAMYADQASYTPSTTEDTLYAVWMEYVEISFNANDGSGTTVIQDSAVVGLATNLDPVTLEKAGYYLYGWATTSGGDAFYQDEASYTPGTASDVLYAIWETIPDQAEVLKLSDITYAASAGKLTINSYTGDGQDSTYLFFPDTFVIDGVSYGVDKVASGAFANKGDKITDIILPNTINSLATNAFANCSLDSVTIPKSMTLLISKAFKNQGGGTSLTKVNFEDGSMLGGMQVSVFAGNTNLPSFTLPTRTGYKWRMGADSTLTDLVVLNVDFDSTFTAVEDTPTGLRDINESSKSELTISPNPASSMISINVAAMSSQIYDISGKSVKQYPAGMQTLDISDLRNGMYFLRVNAVDGSVFTEQLIKK